jgi:HAMP domain-containing protein
MDEQSVPLVRGGFNITGQDSLGAILLAILALVLLFALLRAQGRNRKLVRALARSEAKTADGRG